MVSCCSHKKKDKTCKRNSDGKVFKLPRRFSRKKCLGKIRGFSMRSSCAPYVNCKTPRMSGGNRPSQYPSLSNMLIEPYSPNYAYADLSNLRVEGYTNMSSASNAASFSGGGKRNTAVAVLAPNKNGVSGVVHFTETSNGLKIDYEINGLSDGKHGFHIHEFGDLTDGCKSACSHFNPFGKTHGDVNSSVRHAGDLGNVISKNKKSKGTIMDKILSLDFNKQTCIVGRMIIVHKDEDDLGLGGDQESLKTGNAGERLACGVIGLKGTC
jgi:Cu-Zn family superoxide dismutase